MKPIQSILTALEYAPFVTKGIIAAEAAIGPGNGKSKFAMVIAAVQAVAKTGEAVPVPQVALISALIDIICSILNAAGVLLPTPAIVPVPVVPAVVAPIN